MSTAQTDLHLQMGSSTRAGIPTSGDILLSSLLGWEGWGTEYHNKVLGNLLPAMDRRKTDSDNLPLLPKADQPVEDKNKM